ncbi:MAG: putative peptidoglycan glycosyltransferase FtsW [Planctomycetota bacterium]
MPDSIPDTSPKPDVSASHGVILSAIALLCIGVVMVHSAGLSIGASGTGAPWLTIQSRPVVYALLAVAAMFTVWMLPAGWLRGFLFRIGPLTPLLMLGAVLCVYVPGLGHEEKGALRWIKAPGMELTAQPSEIAKWAIGVFVAWYAVRFSGRLRLFWKGLLPALAAIGLIALLVAVEDLGTGVIIAATGSLLLVAGGARITHFLMMAPIGIGALAALILTSDYRVRRIGAFADPYADPEGSGFHIIQSLVAIAHGGPSGRGLGFGLQKFGYLPEDRTDFLFSVICEELGLIGAAGVISLYLVMLWCGYLIVRGLPDRFSALVATGVLVTIAGQATMNLFVVTGLAPTKGIALPLLSAGGTGWVLTGASLGLLACFAQLSKSVHDAPAHELSSA